MNIRATALLLLLVFCSTAGADVVHLANGDRLKGEIIAQDGTHITLKTKYSTIRIAKARISRIEKKVKPEERINIHLKNGSIYRGVVLRQTGEYILIRRNNGKRAIFLKANIARTDWNTKTGEKIASRKDDRSEKPNTKKPAASKGNGRPEKTAAINRTDRQPLRIHRGSLPGFSGTTNGKIRWNSVWRSALLPSWGQFYQERKTMGWIYAGAMGLSLLGMGYSWIGYRIEKSAWDAGDRSQSQYDRMEKKSNLYFAFSIAALSVWLLNIADAAIFSPAARKAGVSASLTPDPAAGGIRSGLHIRF